MKKKTVAIGLIFLLIFAGMSVVGLSRASIDENIEINENDEAYFEVEIVDYPDEVELGEEIEIEYYIENTGNLPGEQEVFVYLEAEVAGQEVWSESQSEDVILIPDEEIRDVHTVDTSEIEDEYDQEIFEVEVDVHISIETEDDHDEATITFILPGLIPGFTFILLLSGIAFAVVIYHTKEL